ncbi:hypothetical protein GCM10027062_43380 [Nocardioides hungaricus]
MTRALLAGLAVLAVTLAGCSSDDGDPGSGASGAPGTPSDTAEYLDVPDGVELTAPGSQLAVGDHAVVAYQPRQGLIGALDIQVRRLERVPIGDLSAWQLSAAQQKSTPYYVSARIENVGDTDLGGREVPLYIVNDDNVLVEPTPFASSFKPCPSTPFPKRFKPGASVRSCLVFLAPDKGRLVAVSFRPDETFNPITWTGDIEKPQKPKKGKGKKG